MEFSLQPMPSGLEKAHSPHGGLESDCRAKKYDKLTDYSLIKYRRFLFITDEDCRTIPTRLLFVPPQKIGKKLALGCLPNKLDRFGILSNQLLVTRVESPLARKKTPSTAILFSLKYK